MAGEERRSATAGAPVAAVTACDGTLALSTGGAIWPGNHGGTFNTVWQLGSEGWRWVVDWGADAPLAADPGRVAASRASCRNLTKADAAYAALGTNDAVPVSCSGASADGSLLWQLRRAAAGGAFGLRVWAWNGSGFDRIAALEPAS